MRFELPQLVHTGLPEIAVALGRTESTVRTMYREVD